MPAALITVGTTGIGRTTAEPLRACGHQVAVTGSERMGSTRKVTEAVAFLT
jgi:NAD(P)-dependent dehydrogenase (short-subunit alcohol dehydrogenase family)